MHDDRERWDERYRNGAHTGTAPAETLRALGEYLKVPGRALDLGGGCGRNAIWLAQQGWDVTLADVSSVALSIAAERAASANVPLTTVTVDVDEEPFPTGSWDLILTCLFLWRPLFAIAPQVLAPGGRLIIIQPTLRNLERHPKPPAAFLLNENELPQLANGLVIEHHVEEWSADGRHDAVLVARRDDS